MKYLIANWKAHKNGTAAKQWVENFSSLIHADDYTKSLLESKKVTVIVCPPAHLLPLVQELKSVPNTYIGVQNIAPFPQGNFTGEIAAELVQDIAHYAIIGHSERRRFFHESEDDIAKKISEANRSNIKPILCVQNEKDHIYESAPIIAYEPVAAIGTGHNAPVQQAVTMRNTLQITQDKVFLYGGSVNPENCGEYLNDHFIDGLLIGTASLDAAIFHSILKQIK